MSTCSLRKYQILSVLIFARKLPIPPESRRYNAYEAIQRKQSRELDVSEKLGLKANTMLIDLILKKKRPFIFPTVHSVQ